MDIRVARARILSRMANPLVVPQDEPLDVVHLSATQALRPQRRDMFGSPDDLKLRACMTLFDAVAPGEPGFRELLARLYAGEPNAATLALLR